MSDLPNLETHQPANLDCVLDPIWEIGWVDMADQRAVVLTFKHPKLGSIRFVIPQGGAAVLAAHISQICAGENKPVERKEMN